MLEFLRDEFPESELLYVQIVPQAWWNVHTRKLPRWLDHYVTGVLHKRYCIHEIWFRDICESHYQFEEVVMYRMLHTDLVHFNYHGNTAFAATLMRPRLHKWKNPCKTGMNQV